MLQTDIEMAFNNYNSVLEQYGNCYLSVANGVCKVYTDVSDEVLQDTFSTLCKEHGLGNFVFLEVNSDPKYFQQYISFYMTRILVEQRHNTH